MSADLNPIAVATPNPAAVAEPLCQRRIDRVDEPARPLGAKRAALQIRRKRPAGRTGGSKTASFDAGTRTLVSQDKTVAFTLRATALGLVIERTQRQVVGTSLLQVLVFTEQTAFDRWCEFEPMRFEDALLCSRLRREGHAALTAKT
jgi:hypothetical protein